MLCLGQVKSQFGVCRRPLALIRMLIRAAGRIGIKTKTKRRSASGSTTLTRYIAHPMRIAIYLCASQSTKQQQQQQQQLCCSHNDGS